MTSEFYHRHRAGIVLVVYLTLSMIFLTNRVDPYIHGIKSTIYFIISPDVVYSGHFFNKLDSLRGRFFQLSKALGENHILKEQIIDLALKEVERDELERENNRLRNLLELRNLRFSESIPAEVVGRDVRDWFYSVVVNKGRKENIRKSAAVIAGRANKPALVGRVVEVEEHTSKVLLITDPLSAVSVSVGAENTLGLLEGRNRPDILVRYLPARSQLENGDEVKTVGLGGVFPPGVPVGRVTKVTRTGDGFFKEAVIRPYIDFGSLQEVLILKRETTPGLEAKP